jgi:hypothetical protein
MRRKRSTSRDVNVDDALSLPQRDADLLADAGMTRHPCRGRRDRAMRYGAKRRSCLVACGDHIRRFAPDVGAVDANDDRPSWMASVHQVSLRVLLPTSMFNAWRPISQGRLVGHLWAQWLW